ncbi:MltA domain-containing protein [uncultured Sphingomonas sp.]|uniref:murein transglycosylase A n=1 Tax=uncultured Sphingomonas sp. TaxID=158754 RepID=UPI0025FE52D2|nr:MltA domain-containing protein [uncultured Sphingomonas sp.]
MRIAFVRGAATLFVALTLAACSSHPRERPHSARPPVSTPAPTPPKPATPPPPPPPTRAVEAGVFAGPAVESFDLSPEAARAALDAFRLSCKAVTRRTDVSGLTRPADWQPACTAAATGQVDPIGFFRTHFETVIVGGGALFATGYYEPEIEGSREKTDDYAVPVYRRPPDLLDADPVTRRKGKGRVDENGRYVLYHDRAAIDAGVLDGKGLEIGYARDPVEFFFLQIQGSGRLILPDGGVLRIGYDGQNGREYVGVGRLMRDKGLIGGKTGYATSMQGIMQYMRDHPDELRPLLEANKSYVFFHELTGAGPLGALGVAVTGHVSVAADPKYIPLGAPIWLSADRPEATGLWVAQDTGGAIKGANRVDTFWGAGVMARITAGGMSAKGQAAILVPRGTLGRLNQAGLTGGTPARR